MAAPPERDPQRWDADLHPPVQRQSRGQDRLQALQGHLERRPRAERDLQATLYKSDGCHRKGNKNFNAP